MSVKMTRYKRPGNILDDDELFVVDASVRASGWARFRGRCLVDVGVLKTTADVALDDVLHRVAAFAEDMLGEPDTVIVEYPTSRGGNTPDLDDVIAVGSVAGAWASHAAAVTGASAYLVTPNEWKGGREKRVENAATWRELTNEERAIFVHLGLRHDDNALDAAGIGLWAVRRRGRR